MATYPIKMLQDESGQPFVPANQNSALLGDKYISSILTATKDDASHYTIT